MKMVCTMCTSAWLQVDYKVERPYKPRRKKKFTGRMPHLYTFVGLLPPNNGDPVSLLTGSTCTYT